jgi:hypothetical protein
MYGINETSAISTFQSNPGTTVRGAPGSIKQNVADPKPATK